MSKKSFYKHKDYDSIHLRLANTTD